MGRKIIVIIITAVIFIVLSPSICAAQLGEEEKNYLNSVNDELNSALNEDTRDYLDENDISLDGDISDKLSFKEILATLLDAFLFGLESSIKLFATLLAIVLLCALSDGLSPESGDISKTLDLVGVLAAIGVLFTKVISTIEYITSTVTDTGRFLLTYVPVFASVVGASGSISGAASYYVTLIAIAEISSALAVNILLPLLSIMLSLSIVESINSSLALSGFTNAVKKAFQWIIGLIMTVFVGAITIQGIVGVSADTVGTKAAKFLVSSFVPVVGGAISDAYTTVKGSLGIIRSSVGGFGIVAVLAMIIPPLASVLNVKIAISAAGITGEVLGVKRVTCILKNTNSVLTLAMSVMLCMGLMLIISTTVMMLVCLNL